MGTVLIDTVLIGTVLAHRRADGGPNGGSDSRGGAEKRPAHLRCACEIHSLARAAPLLRPAACGGGESGGPQRSDLLFFLVFRRFLPSPALREPERVTTSRPQGNSEL